MSDETGEREDVTVDEQGCIVQGDVVVQPPEEAKIAEERRKYREWRLKAGDKLEDLV